MATILVNDPIHAEGLARLRTAGHEIIEGPLEDDERAKTLKEIEGLVVRSGTKVTAEFLSGCPELKVIGRAGVGVDNIDLEVCEERGIVVCNSPGASSNAVAELTFAHMLAVVRNLPRANESLRDGQWLKKELSGFELKGRTLGLVGIGRIGARVAELAGAFGMTVEAYDPYVDEAQATELGVSTLHDDLFELAARCDIVSIHTPLNEETEGMVGASFFEEAPEGLVVINCARGGVLDEDALLMAMEEGKVLGAGLDVYTEEPPGKHNLFGEPHLSLTPHIGAATEEAQIKAGTTIADSITAVLEGGEPESRVV